MRAAGDLEDVRPGRQRLSLALAILTTIPALVLRLGHVEVSHPVAALTFGRGNVGAAYVFARSAATWSLENRL